MKKIRSINLGGWFVLEYWMKKPLFIDNNVKGHDETVFSAQATNSDDLLQKHHREWITLDDLIWIKKQGVNLVRIPIPWWLYGDDRYYRSIEELDQVLVLLEDIGLDYMLDLHTAPGCQNGFDNGGMEGVLEWHKKPEYIDKTIEVLEKVMRRYKAHSHFHSIELLNEPNIVIDINILKDFYKNAYKRLRNIDSEKYIVMHDGFRLHEWKEFFTENKFHNVILDTHMYQCFDDSIKGYTIDEHCQHTMKRTKLLAEVEEYVPVIVGEWSLGLSHNQYITKSNEHEAMKQYASAQLQAMSKCTGHIFWSYKVFDDFAGWNFRQLVETGVINMEEFLQ
jgi:glucan 1,3-beta-glucosidase